MLWLLKEILSRNLRLSYGGGRPDREGVESREIVDLGESDNRQTGVWDKQLKSRKAPRLLYKRPQ